MDNQPWGVAFRYTDGTYKWCSNHGPHRSARFTKRASLMSALKSNNGVRGGPYVPIPLVDFKSYPLTDMKPFSTGPYSDDLNALYERATKLLTTQPDLDYEALLDSVSICLARELAGGRT